MSKKRGGGMVDSAVKETGIGTSPSGPQAPPMTVGGADEAKIRAIQRQVAEHKSALGDLQLRYESSKGHIVAALQGCEQRALAIANEAAIEKGLDPSAYTFDWNSLSFVAK